MVPAILLLLLLTTGGCRQKPSPLTREEVIKAIEQFDKGWKDKNLGMVDAVLSPVYIYFTQSGGIFERDRLVQTAGSATYTLDSMARLEFLVELYGNTAVVSTRWKGKGWYKGVYFNEDQRCSLTIVKIENRVSILSEHCTPINSKRVFH